MSDYVESHPVEEILQRHDIYAAAVAKNEELSDIGKQRAIEASFQSSRHDAVALANKLLSEAADAIQVAQTRTNQAAQAWQEAVPADRQLVAFRQADNLEYARDAATVEQFVNGAIQRGDVASLRAFETVAPKLLNKTGQTGAPFKSLDIHHLIGRTQEALANLEPESLKKSRQELEQATANARKLERTLVSINQRRSRHGGHGPLANVGHGVRTETYTNPKTGASSTRYVATGGNWF